MGTIQSIRYVAKKIRTHIAMEDLEEADKSLLQGSIDSRRKLRRQLLKDALNELESASSEL